MEVKLEDILKNDKQYIKILRLLHLIKGLTLSRRMKIIKIDYFWKTYFFQIS